MVSSIDSTIKGSKDNFLPGWFAKYQTVSTNMYEYVDWLKIFMSLLIF